MNESVGKTQTREEGLQKGKDSWNRKAGYPNGNI